MMIKKKITIGKLLTLAVMLFTMSMLFSFSTVSAAAADTKASVDTDTTVSQIDNSSDVGMITMEVNTEILPHHTIMPLAGGAAGGAAGGSGGGTTAEDAYQNVVSFFVTWIRRLGAFVALIGGIMFGLAIKDNNADQKQAGLMTLIAGFVVVAITAAVDMFDLFT